MPPVLTCHLQRRPHFWYSPAAPRQVAPALCPNDQSKTCFLLRRRAARPVLHFEWRSRSGMGTVGNGRPSRPGTAAGRGGGAVVLRRPDELRVLNAVAEALNSSPDVRQALERTLTLVASLLGLRTGWVWLLDPETQQFYSAAVQHLPPYLHEPVRMTGRSCWCIEEFNAGELTPKNIDVIECSRLRPAVKKKAVHLTHGLRYHASIPLYFQKKPLGIMNLTGPSWRRLSAGELRLLATIAYQVGIALERARLAEESARLARTEERARIAREIHDTLAQGLTAIALHLE